jgi:Plasmid pRiA4b ORF-3-like protein
MKKAAKTIRVVYQLKVTLRNVHPPVWRRVQVWEDGTLGELHRVLQIVMGWEDCQFKIGESDYSIPSPDDEFFGRPVIDQTRVTLQNVVPPWGRSSSIGISITNVNKHLQKKFRSARKTAAM